MRLPRGHPPGHARIVGGALLLLGCLGAGACVAGGSGGSGSSGAPGPAISAVASIDAWGSILGQLGGTRVRTTSIITSPNVDPHSYQPTPADGIAIARAQVVVVNGIGYDAWASKSVAADASGSRQLVDVGEVVGIGPGGNPHQWYSRASVRRVVQAITTALTTADPGDAAYFAARRAQLETVGFARYDALEAAIAKADARVAVGASESIATPLAATLGLDLVTPPAFLRATSEGTDPAPGDVATIGTQIRRHRIAVYLDNIQNSTPDVSAQVAAAKAAGIPVVGLTETLSPSGTSFQDWQVAQLQALAAALAAARATARSTGGTG